MNNADFWSDIRKITADGFTSEGLRQLERYAELFISGRLVYQRFSPREQHGCAAGGATHVIASLLAGAEDTSDTNATTAIGGRQRERQCGAKQEQRIEQWAKAVGCWIENVEETLPEILGSNIAEGGEAKVYDHGATLIKSIGLDYFLLPVLALDRISLHNAYFPETRLLVIGFGRTKEGNFKVIVEQPFIEGEPITDDEISHFTQQMGFTLKNPHNWTYATPEIYLSDMHDENVIRSHSGAIFVIDCDIRINTPALRQGGIRKISNEVKLLD